MKVFPVLGLCVLLTFGAEGLIVPDEIPSLLSLIYSNIPTVKKGTDSRVGWGFRLGDRADFQVMLELGPQTNTQPLANQGDDNSRKRDAENTRINQLYAAYHDSRQQQLREQQIRQQQQQQQLKRLQQQLQKQNQQPEANTISETEGGKWLSNWKANVAKTTPEPLVPLIEDISSPKPGLGIGEIDAKSVIPDDSIIQLRELYRKHPKEVMQVLESLAKFATTEKTTQVKSTTSKEDALDNVDLE